MDWLFSGELWWHDILRLMFNGVVGFLAVAALTTIFRGRIANWLSPFTPGGVGNTTDEEGVKAHERLATPRHR